MYKDNKIIVVLPAYNAEKTIKKTVDDIPQEIVDKIILVDDKSSDQTIKIAEELNLDIIQHHKNKGYGGNQKSCYDAALKADGDIIIMLHPDYQYDPRVIKYFVEFIADDYFDVMLGSRIRSRKEALAGGMPKYKYYFNRMLSFIENVISGQNLSEWHTGMRAYKKSVLKKINYKDFSNDFVFDSQALFSIIKHGFRIGEIPVPVRYFKEASSINFWRSTRYGLSTLKVAFSFLFKK